MLCKWPVIKNTVLFSQASNFIVNIYRFFCYSDVLFSLNLSSQLDKLYLFCIKEVDKLQASEEGTFLIVLLVQSYA